MNAAENFANPTDETAAEQAASFLQRLEETLIAAAQARAPATVIDHLLDALRDYEAMRGL